MGDNPLIDRHKRHSVIIITIIRIIIIIIIIIINYLIHDFVHRCGAGVSMRACQAAGPGSIPGRDVFPG